LEKARSLRSAILTKWLRDSCVFRCALLCAVVPNATGATRKLLIKSGPNYQRFASRPANVDAMMCVGSPRGHHVRADGRLSPRSEDVVAGQQPAAGAAGEPNATRFHNDHPRSKGADRQDGFGESVGGFLRQIVTDATG
jgi:hypothetical protein